MKRTILFAIILNAFLFQFAFGQTSKKILSTIVIDPGHGGADPGAKGIFSTEAELSLAVALKLGKAIREEFPEIKLVYTRTEDKMAGNKRNVGDANRYRADLANSSGGNLFIAIHCNSAGKKAGGWHEKRVVRYETKFRNVKKGKKTIRKKYSEPVYETFWVENLVKGTETYIWAVDKNEAKTASMMKNVNFHGEIDSTANLSLPDPENPEDAARMLIYTQNYFRKSLTMADLVEKQFVVSGRISRGVKQRNDKGIWVLQATGMPSILIELGFITNKEEEEYLNSEKGQDEIVKNIVNALKEYKQKLETRAVNSESKLIPRK